MPEEPEAWGLLALMGLHASRRAARIGPDGALVLLEAQERRRWDREQIAASVRVLEYALGPVNTWPST